MSYIFLIIGIIFFVIFVSISVGVVAFCCYKQSKKENFRRKHGKRRSKSSSKSRSRSSSSSSKSKSRSRSSRSRSKSSSSDKKHRSSRRRSSRSHRGKSSSSDGERRHSKSRSRRSSRSKNLQSFNNSSFPGEIKVDVGPKKDTKGPITGNNLTIVSPPPQVDQGSKKDTICNSTPMLSQSENVLQNTKIDTTGNIPSFKPLEIPSSQANEPISNPSNILKICQDGKQMSNDLLKYKTNTHYIPSTTVNIPKEVPEIKNIGITEEKPTNKKVKSGQNDGSLESLLTSNNLTYNNVNIMVNSVKEDDINDVIKKAVHAIPDPDLNLSEIPGLPSSRNRKNDNE